MDQSSTKSIRGTGLGLSICRNIINLLGGDIGVSSELGKGSNFGFKIPIEIGSEENLAKSENKEIATFDEEELKILIAEDNPINLVYITGVLEKYNFSFKTVTNGQEAVDALKENSEYNAVFMDCGMPFWTKYVVRVKRCS